MYFSVRNIPLLLGFAYLVAFGFLVTANHTGVPFWDEWDVYVGWLLIDNASLQSMIKTHNEHLAIVPKLINFIDFELGFSLKLGKFLTVFLMFFAAWLFCKSDYVEGVSVRSKLILFLIFALPITSWAQNENFIWANQFGFLLGIIGPLITIKLVFYMPARATHRFRLRAVGYAIAIFSSFSLISAFLVWPILAALHAFRRERKGFLISILLMILMGLFIGFDVSAPEHHPPQFDPFNTDVHDAFKLLSFFLTLMFSIIPQLDKMVLGLVLGIAVYAFWDNFSSPKEYVTENHRLIAETFVLISYLCLVGAAISVARYKFGLDTAYTSRYMVLSLCLISILAWYFVCSNSNGNAVLLCLLFLFLPNQLEALKDDPNRVFTQKMSALSLYAGVYADEYTTGIYYQKLPKNCTLNSLDSCRDSHFFEKIQQVIRSDVGFFGEVKARGLLPNIGRHYNNAADQDDDVKSWSPLIDDKCEIVVDFIGEKMGQIFVSGWKKDAFWPEQSVAYSINSDGFLVFGKWRPDVGHNHGKQFNWTGFEGTFSRN